VVLLLLLLLLRGPLETLQAAFWEKKTRRDRS
jgi:hypothetical protein